jgi:hypothetical protein
MIKDRFTKHRARWLRRIELAECKAKLAENGIHSVLDYIEDNDLDETIHKMLMEVIGKMESNN